MVLGFVGPSKHGRVFMIKLKCVGEGYEESKQCNYSF